MTTCIGINCLLASRIFRGREIGRSSMSGLTLESFSLLAISKALDIWRSAIGRILICIGESQSGRDGSFPCFCCLAVFSRILFIIIFAKVKKLLQFRNKTCILNLNHYFYNKLISFILNPI